MRRTFAQLAIATKPFTVEDRAKTWRLLGETFLVGALLFAGAATGFPAPVRLVFSVLLGLTLVRIFIFYHDFQHGAIFRNSRAAEHIMRAFGLIILNPPSAWKRSHDYHHQHNSQIATASIGSFPIFTVEQYREASFLQKLEYNLARHPITVAFGYAPIFVMGMCGKSFFKDPRRHWDSGLALGIHALLVAVFAAGGWQLLWFAYLIPLMVACALGAYLFYIQHNFPDVYLKPRTEWDYVSAALMSSSYLEGGRLLHWFTGNIGYHHVHHLNPTIPFYRLPEAMAAIPELQNPSRTSLRPMEIVRCFRLKLWDPAAGRMVGWRGR